LDFLETVDKQQCILVDKEIRRRDAFSYPGFITGIIAFIMVFHFIFTEHNSKYIRFNKNLHDYTLEYKAQYEDKAQRDKLPSFILDKYAPYFNQEKLSILDYIHVYFGGHITSTPYIDTSILSTLLISLVYLIVVSGYQSFFKKNPILVFNRERNLVYTWRKNKVFIARYPEIGIGKIGKTLT
ncbi:hypothetical protein NAB31_18135, partial [Proteus mirabilis]|nr:hypothetical protein [Proteus mirabilis]MDF7340156.1 hypothetical protein [Proteus mirabilis]